MSVEKLLARGRPIATTDPVGNLVEAVGALVQGTRSLRDEKLTRSVFSLEERKSEDVAAIGNVYANVEAGLHGICDNLKISLEDWQFGAASMAAILSADPKAAVMSKPARPSGEYRLTQPNTGDGSDVRGFSMEAYLENDNRSAQTHSIVYNLLASRQDDFGEAHYPTITISATEAGILLEARLLYVYNDFKRATSGNPAAYGRVNVIRAYANNTILKNDLTQAVPVVRTGGTDDNTASFIAAADMAPYVKSFDGLTITTAPLKIGKEVDLIGLSQTAELLASGVMGPSDVLDTYARLDKIYIKFDDGTNTSVVAFDTSVLPDSVFTYAPTGNSRRMILNIDTNSIVFSSATKDVDGNAPAALSAVTAGVTGRLKLSLSGNLVLDKSTVIVNNGSVSLNIMRAANGTVMTPSNATLAIFDNAVCVGYDVTAYRANVNLRQRGQLVDSQREAQIVNVRFRSPVSQIMPTGDASGNDSSVVQTLINITSIRTSNEAVTALLAAENALASYKAVPDNDGVLPDLFGIGRYYIIPTYFSETLNMVKIVDSLKSHERLKDLRSALIEKLRYYATEMYRTSEYKAAALVLNGNINFKPTINVGTDLFLYNYLMSDGDLRTLGEQFEVKVTATQDNRMKNKIIMTFGVYDANRNSVVNPLNSGNMLWSPETVVVLPISRDGQISKEAIVAPRFYHMTNLPAMTSLTVENLPLVLSKVAQINTASTLAQVIAGTTP